MMKYKKKMRKQLSKSNKQHAYALSLQKLFNYIDIRESYVSLILGVATVFLITISLFLAVLGKNIHFTFFTPTYHTKSIYTQGIQTVNKQKLPSSSILGNSYLVKDGDTLWDISIRAYGRGDKWEDIVNANNIYDSDYIMVGQSLAIPR